MKKPIVDFLPCSPENKVKFMELNAELRELKSLESLTDYQRTKWEISDTECFDLKEKIQTRFTIVLEERNKISSNK